MSPAETRRARARAPAPEPAPGPEPAPVPAVESTRRLLGASFDLLTQTSDDMRRASFYIGLIVLGTVGPLAVASFGLEVVSIHHTRREMERMLDEQLGAVYALLAEHRRARAVRGVGREPGDGRLDPRWSVVGSSGHDAGGSRQVADGVLARGRRCDRRRHPGRHRAGRRRRGLRRRLRPADGPVVRQLGPRRRAGRRAARVRARRDRPRRRPAVRGGSTVVPRLRRPQGRGRARRGLPDDRGPARAPGRVGRSRRRAAHLRRPRSRHRFRAGRSDPHRHRHRRRGLRARHPHLHRARNLARPAGGHVRRPHPGDVRARPRPAGRRERPARPASGSATVPLADPPDAGVLRRLASSGWSGSSSSVRS